MIKFYGIRTFSQSVRLVAAGLLVSLLTNRQGLPQRPAKDAQFEVFSIRQSRPGTPQGSNAGIQPNGYQARGQSLWATLMLATFAVDFSEWRSGMILGLPPWASSTLYDIDARVASADLPRWQQQDRSHELLSQMLRTALQERCHLVMHRVAGKEKIFALVVGKSGAKLTAAKASPSEGIPFAEGRLIPGVGSIQLRGVSMKSLAQFLSRSSPRIVVEQTALQGLYDITLTHDDSGSGEPDAASVWNVAALGLALKSSEREGQVVVVDRLDPPTPN